MKKNTVTVEQIINAADVEGRVMTITPAIAEEMLKCNDHNRPISKKYVDSYADSMKSGKWLLNGQAIVFDKNGKLTDGQHRLLAVVKSGCSIDSLVVGAVDPEAFTTYDCGRSRTLGQLIGMRSVKNYNAVAAVVKYYHALCTDTAANDNSNNCIAVFSEKRLTNTDLVELYNADSEKYNHYGEIATRLSNSLKKAPITGSTAASVWMYLVEHHGYDYDFVAEFFNQLYSYKTPTIHVVELLWMRLLDMRAGTDRHQATDRRNYMQTMEYKLNLLAKTWNYYAIGKDVKSLTFAVSKGKIDFLTASQAENAK